MEALTPIISFVGSAIMILGSVGGYIPQYLEIRKTRNAEGFSTLVSLALIASNTIRIYFWFAKPFDNTLLTQAVAVVVFQLALVQVCTDVRFTDEKKRRSADGVLAAVPERRFTDFELQDFWAWDHFSSYFQAWLSLNALLLVFMLLLGSSVWFVELLGSIALGVEAMLAVPQAWRNYKQQSVQGLSSMMVVSWAVGDAYKLVYYTVSDVPYQFMYCGVFQFCTDTFILFQMFVLYVPGRPVFDLERYLKKHIRGFMLKYMSGLVGGGSSAGHSYNKGGADERGTLVGSPGPGDAMERAGFEPDRDADASDSADRDSGVQHHRST